MAAYPTSQQPWPPYPAGYPQGYPQGRPAQAGYPQAAGWPPAAEVPGYPGVAPTAPAAPAPPPLAAYKQGPTTWQIPLGAFGPVVPSAAQFGLEPTWPGRGYEAGLQVERPSVDRFQHAPAPVQVAGAGTPLVPSDTGPIALPEEEDLSVDPVSAAQGALAGFYACADLLEALQRRTAGLGFDIVRDLAGFYSRNDVGDDDKRSISLDKLMIANMIDVARLDLESRNNQLRRDKEVLKARLAALAAEEKEIQKDIANWDKKAKQAKSDREKLKPLADEMKAQTRTVMQQSLKIAGEMRDQAVRRGKIEGLIVAGTSVIGATGPALAGPFGSVVRESIRAVAEIVEVGAYAAHERSVSMAALEIAEAWEDAREYAEMMTSKGQDLIQRLDSKISKLQGRENTANSIKESRQRDLKALQDRIRQTNSEIEKLAESLSKTIQDLESWLAYLEEAMRSLQNLNR
jgi:peptidoglycan hydrolase CwlO-like protein